MLKEKLRDHVSGIFGGLAKIDEQKRVSTAVDTYNFDSRMKKEMTLVCNYFRLRKSSTSEWSEKDAFDKIVMKRIKEAKQS